MSTKVQEVKEMVSKDFEASKKAFHEAMAKAQSRIEAAAAEIDKLHANLKTQTTGRRSRDWLATRLSGALSIWIVEAPVSDGLGGDGFGKV